MSATTKINWVTTSFIVGYHLIVLTALPFFFIYNTLTWPIAVTTVAFWFATGWSVTAGYHRLYSHQAYKVHPVIEFLLLFLGAMSVQGCVYSWAHDHRLHHAHSDTDKDPYSVKDGFLHAHLLWMFKRLPTMDPKVVSDLRRNRLVMHQHRYYVLWMLGSNLLVTLITGYLTGAWVASFLFVWGVRMLLCHHCTWFINSLAHVWGHKPFSKEQSAVDNFILSLMTFGEGYHNYHHTFARDYRNGVRWYHFDPTKWSIWLLSKLGLAHSLARTSKKRIAERMAADGAQPEQRFLLPSEGEDQLLL
ncbi:MAG: acyl-CoA desaturase [Parachlamydiales bacterium]